VSLASPLGRLLSLLAVAGLAVIAYFAFIKDEGGSSGADSLFKTANLTRALGAVRAREGGGAPMIEVQVYPERADFEVVDGARIRLYRYDAKTRDMEYRGIRRVETGDHRFSLRRVGPDVAPRLARAVRRRERGLKATAITLARNPVLRWTIAAEDRATDFVFTAETDGSGLTQFRRVSRRD
jgi:hypothetical protein